MSRERLTDRNRGSVTPWLLRLIFAFHPADWNEGAGLIGQSRPRKTDSSRVEGFYNIGEHVGDGGENQQAIYPTPQEADDCVV
jgi:hypothetical protein